MFKQNLEKKTQDLIDCILNAAAGNYSTFFPASTKNDRIDTIGIAFNSLLEEIRTSSSKREKEILVWRRVLHDIRGPIGSLGVLFNMIIQEIREEKLSQSGLIEYLEAAIRSSSRILGSINNMMQQPNSPQNNLSRIRIQNLVNEILEFSLINQFSKDFQIVVKEDNFLFFSDPVLIMSVFKNLIENSYKYRKKTGNAYLMIEAKNIDDKAFLIFSDNGIGISDSNIHRVFQMYTKLSNDSNGLGYGLYSVKRDVEILGGEIEINSLTDSGTTISIILPVNISGNLNGN